MANYCRLGRRVFRYDCGVLTAVSRFRMIADTKQTAMMTRGYRYEPPQHPLLD